MIRKIQKLYQTKQTHFAVSCANMKEATELLEDLGKLGFMFEQNNELTSLLNSKGDLNGNFLAKLSEDKLCFDFFGTHPRFDWDSKRYFSKMGIEILEFSQIKNDWEPDFADDENLTYVEVFDDCAIENICSALALKPRKIILVGDDRRKLRRACNTYRSILIKDNNLIELEMRYCDEGLPKIIDVFTDIVHTEEQCCFDITGGKDIFLTALGYVWGRYPEKNIQVHRFDLMRQQIIDCDGDQVTPFQRFPKLTVKENIKIYGGKIIGRSVKSHDEIEQDDLHALWELLQRVKNKEWNTTLTRFREYVSEKDENVRKTEFENGEITYFKTPSAINRKDRTMFESPLLAKLSDLGLVSVGETDDGAFDGNLTFKNAFVRDCLMTEGQLLEYKIYDIACKAKEKDGVTPFFCDAQTGVEIDWVPEYKTEESPSTNEVDVIMMDGIVPIFISCKNGSVKVEELYKFNTVTENFGGKYAVKMLITNRLDETVESMIRQRCKELHIKFIPDVQGLDDADIEMQLKEYNF